MAQEKSTATTAAATTKAAPETKVETKVEAKVDTPPESAKQPKPTADTTSTATTAAATTTQPQKRNLKVSCTHRPRGVEKFDPIIVSAYGASSAIAQVIAQKKIGGSAHSYMFQVEEV